MTTTEIGVSSLLTLVATVAGARISSRVCRNYGALASFRLSLASLAASYLGIAITVRGHGQMYLYYVWNVLFGCSIGWFYPTERVLFCILATPASSSTTEEGAATTTKAEAAASVVTVASNGSPVDYGSSAVLLSPYDGLSENTAAVEDVPRNRNPCTKDYYANQDIRTNDHFNSTAAQQAPCSTSFDVPPPPSTMVVVMGIIQSVNSVLAWLPTLLFSVLNEIPGLSLRYAVASQSVLVLVGLVASFRIHL